MRIFASWSGQPSRDVAILLKNWLPNVLQEVEVYVSSQDIAKGERWLHNVNDNLQDHDFGFSILTPHNVTAPWILFEAGALAKSLKSRLVPLLCGLSSIDLPNHPLTQFQYVLAPQQGEMLRLVSDINGACARPLPEDRLKATFEKWYPDFVEAFQQIDLSVKKRAKTDAEQAPSDLIAQNLSELRREMRDLRAEMRAVQSTSTKPASGTNYVLWVDDEARKNMKVSDSVFLDKNSHKFFWRPSGRNEDDGQEPA